MPVPDVLIVGGGVIGAACARTLAGRGVSVQVIESGPEPGAATPASAGMLAPFAEAEPEDPLLGIGIRARDLYRELAPSLLEETGIDIGLWLDGIVEVAFSEADLDAIRTAVAVRRQAGFTVGLLTREELVARIPGVGPAALGASLAPEDGALDPIALHRALLASAERRGARITNGEHVQEIVVDGDRATGVRTAGGTAEAGAVLVAAGAWSGRLSGLPWALPVEPMRGQMAALPWPDDEPQAVIYGGGGYILARGQELVAGSTMERAGFNPITTDGGLAHIFGVMARIFPGLTTTDVIRTWAGLRPVTPDSRPILGEDSQVRGLWYATGHGRNGILLAGITGELIGAMLTGESLDLDLTPLGVSRFRSQ